MVLPDKVCIQKNIFVSLKHILWVYVLVQGNTNEYLQETFWCKNKISGAMNFRILNMVRHLGVPIFLVTMVTELCHNKRGA